MQLKGAVVLVHDWVPAFHSCLFLVKKVTGSWRRVTDLLPFYRFVVLKFRMAMVVSVLVSVRIGNLVSL